MFTRVKVKWHQKKQEIEKIKKWKRSKIKSDIIIINDL